MLLDLFVYYLSYGIIGDKLKQIGRSLWGDMWMTEKRNCGNCKHLSVIVSQTGDYWCVY